MAELTSQTEARVLRLTQRLNSNGISSLLTGTVAVAGAAVADMAGVAVAVAVAVAGAGAVAVASGGTAAASYKLSVGGDRWGGAPVGRMLGTSSMLKNLCMLLIMSTNEGRSWGSLRRQLSVRLLYSGWADRGKRGKSVLGMNISALRTYGCCPVKRDHIKTPNEYTSEPVVTWGRQGQ